MSDPHREYDLATPAHEALLKLMETNPYQAWRRAKDIADRFYRLSKDASRLADEARK